MTYVITGDWLCDQADIEVDEAFYEPQLAVLCDGLGKMIVSHESHTIDRPPVPPRARF